MSVLWGVMAVVVAIVWLVTVADLVRRHLGTKRTVAWLLIVLTLGSIAALALLVRGRELAEEFIRFGAARSGAEVHELTVKSVGLRAIVLGPLRLGGDDGPAASSVHVEWGLAGLLPLATGLVGTCPLYRPFRLDSSGGKP